MNNVKNYTDEQLLEKVKSLSSFKEIPKNYWILGVRSNEDASNVPDDKFYIFQGEKFIKTLTGTTNAGASVLKGGFEKYNKLGTAVVKADECYYNLWSYGMHKGKMRALVQTGEVIIFRDGDKDGKAEEIGKEYKGLFGINFHTMSYDPKSTKVSETIGDWSAGCQVVNDMKKYYETIDLFKNNGKTTYILLNEF